MTTIALIGGDGAGKTTVARALIETSGLPLKYLYMGMSTRSSDHSLFTSRLVYWFKRRKFEKQNGGSGKDHSGVMKTGDLEYSQNSHGWVWNAARFLNRLAEAGYRQILTVIYQLQGKIVLYDRHFFFDSVPDNPTGLNGSTAFFDSLLFQVIDHVYPKPTVGIFLDAPPEVLFSRKGEASPEFLARQREQFLAQGAKLTHFVRVDATQPLEVVINEVRQIVEVVHSRKIANGVIQPQKFHD